MHRAPLPRRADTLPALDEEDGEIPRGALVPGGSKSSTSSSMLRGAR